MRFFPSAVRQRLAVAAVAGAVVLGATSVPLASAGDDDLEDRRDHVERQIEHAEHELEHASARARRATAAVDRAEARLGSARAHLADVRRRLAAARERDVRMQEALAAAEQRLTTAREELAAGRAAVREQREQVVKTVVDIYEQGDPQLLAFTALVNAESPEDLMLRAAAEEAIVQNEDETYDALQVAEDELKAQKEEVKSAKEETERKRDAAAANLAAMRALTTQAEAAQTRMWALVRTSREARRGAVAARAEDRATLARLEEREQRIKQQILAAAQQEGSTYSGPTGGLLAYPVNGSVTSPFGYREHPIYGYWGLHNGTDFGAACGAPLVAGARGTVVEAYYDEVYGNRLYLNVGRVNGANLTLVYNHLSSYAVREGARVGRGAVVGRVGTTGWSTGCHLHFTVLRNGNPVDPMPYL